MRRDRFDRSLLWLALLCVLGFLISMSFIGCASSRTGQVLNVAVVGSGMADLYTTRSAIDQGRGREGNPLLGQSLIRQAIVKALGTSLVIGSAALIEDKGQRVWAHLIRGITISVWSYAAVHNQGVGR